MSAEEKLKLELKRIRDEFKMHESDCGSTHVQSALAGILMNSSYLVIDACGMWALIRLHIIAMHELCEFSRGESFTEGFDSHLNIEQMNKTSVELFQIHDDHRERGIFIPAEKEFRGYYALLKLDKHPGYKVEPAELSLDLAKITAEIRQTLEVLFARDVARLLFLYYYIVGRNFGSRS